jgi:hypothetical protein
MDAQERAEVREIIHGILSGWNARTESYMITTNNSLNNIDTHLKTLNGTVAKHQTTLDQNLPHSEVHCVQKDKIEEMGETLVRLDEKVVTRKSLNATIWKLFGGIIATGGLVFTIWEFFLKV